MTNKRTTLPADYGTATTDLKEIDHAKFLARVGVATRRLTSPRIPIGT